MNDGKVEEEYTNQEGMSYKCKFVSLLVRVSWSVEFWDVNHIGNYTYLNLSILSNLFYFNFLL